MNANGYVGELVEVKQINNVLIKDVCGFVQDPKEKSKLQTLPEAKVIDKDDVGMIIDTNGNWVNVQWIRSGCLWTYFTHLKVM